MVLCDTGIISRYLTGEIDIVDKYTQLSEEYLINISIISRIELLNWLSGYVGLDTRQRTSFRKYIFNLSIIHINEPISKLAMTLSDKYITDKPADLLIGATAIYKDIPLYTLNTKHFIRLQELILI